MFKPLEHFLIMHNTCQHGSCVFCLALKNRFSLRPCSVRTCIAVINSSKSHWITCTCIMLLSGTCSQQRVSQERQIAAPWTHFNLGKQDEGLLCPLFPCTTVPSSAGIITSIQKNNQGNPLGHLCPISDLTPSPQFVSNFLAPSSL